MKYEPRNLTTEQQNFRVDLHASKSPGGAYGYGETLDEAEKNARHFYRRDYGTQAVGSRVVQKYVENHWEIVE